LGTLGNNCPSRMFTASRCAITLACVYTWRVVAKSECPSWACATFKGVPWTCKSVPWVWRSACQLNLGSPARLHADRNPLFRKLRVESDTGALKLLSHERSVNLGGQLREVATEQIVVRV
jgi:hypothetical protein